MTERLDADNERYDPRYLAGVRWFNCQNFFQAHETWESLWVDRDDESKQFYQGLIQAAICLHHFERGNIRGARKLYHSSRAYLEQFGAYYLGLNVAQLLEDMTACCREILDLEEQFPKGKLDPERIPQIHLDARWKSAS